MRRVLSPLRDWTAAVGDIGKFAARMFGEVFRLRLFRFFGEARLFAAYLAVVRQAGHVPQRRFFLLFWMFQHPPDLLSSLIKGMAMATVIVIVGTYYGYTASGGPVGVGTATAESMVLNTVMVHLVGMLGTQIFWGANPRAPIGG